MFRFQENLEMEFWCRVETVGGRVVRVHVMHPNGEIFVSYPPERFSAAELNRMLAGQIRARVSERAEGGATVALVDLSGAVVFEERVP
ncbi:MAG: hypothetical protein ABI592_09150 [Acidobacteriota bacterium]